MKTAITTKGHDESAAFDPRFGRTGWFCVLDEETGNVEFFENEFKNATGGAGTKAAEKMVELGVQKIISGDFGPKAKDLIEKFNIQMVVVEDNQQPIREIIKMLTLKK